MSNPQFSEPQGVQTTHAGPGPRHVMVFDVESIGLQGEGFAVAWQVVEVQTQATLESATQACCTDLAQGSAADRAWVAANVPVLAANCASPAEVRARFWSAWLRWRGQDTWLVADCAWPVETNFLSACVQDAGPDAHFLGPLPLFDLTALTLFGQADASAPLARLPNELPEHDPAADVRHTARKFLALLA